jgi:hypothetical protein
MVPFAYLLTSPSNPESRSTLNPCTVVMPSLLPFRHPPLATSPLQSPPSRWRFPLMSGFPYNPAPTALFSGVPFPISPNSPNRLQPVPFRSWTFSRPRALQPVPAVVCVRQEGNAPAQPVSMALHANRVRKVSLAPHVNRVHRTAQTVIRELQALVDVLTQRCRTYRRPAIVSTVFAVPMDNARAMPVGPPAPMVPHALRV